MTKIIEFPSGAIVRPVSERAKTTHTKFLPEIAVVPFDSERKPTLKVAKYFLVGSLARDEKASLCLLPYAFFFEQSLAQVYAHSLSEKCFLTLPDPLIKELAEQVYTF